MPAPLLTSPVISGGCEFRQRKRCGPANIDSSSNHKQLTSSTQQRSPGHALIGAMMEKTFPGFGKGTALMASPDTRIGEQGFKQVRSPFLWKI
jgi:hypothetical protein